MVFIFQHHQGVGKWNLPTDEYWRIYGLELFA